VVNAIRAGDLAYPQEPLPGDLEDLQLRVSAGLAPVSPLSLPIRGNGTLIAIKLLPLL
jgi:hypothetical protein